MDSDPNLCLSDSEPGIYRSNLESSASFQPHLLCVQCQWWPHTSPCPLEQMHTVGSEHSCSFVWLCAAGEAQPRYMPCIGSAERSSDFITPFWRKTSLRPGGMVSHAMWDKKLEISVAIDDPRACFITALHLPWHCQPCGVGVVCICPAQKSITPSLHWWEVLGVESQTQKGIGLMLASIHLASVVPELLQTGKVWYYWGEMMPWQQTRPLIWC